MLEHQASLRSFEIVPKLNIFPYFMVFLLHANIVIISTLPRNLPFSEESVNYLPVPPEVLKSCAVYRFNPYVCHNFMSDGFKNGCQTHSI